MKLPKQESTEAVVPTASAAAVSNCGAVSNSVNTVSDNVSATNTGTKSFLRQALLATTSQSFTRLRHSSSGLVTSNSNNSNSATLATSGGRIGNQSQSSSVPSDADQPFANIDTSSIAGMDCLDIDLLVKNHQHQEELAGVSSSASTSSGSC